MTHRAILITAALSIFLLALPAFGQQTYVGRWDLYGGFTQINQPGINLGEQGFNLQGGVRLTTWLNAGFDYTVGTESNVLTGHAHPLIAATTRCATWPNGGCGPAPSRLSTHGPGQCENTFQMGPDFPIRHFQAVTFFVRPNLGAMQIVATPRPTDPIASAIIRQLAPAGKKTDWTYFYGFGGGMEYNVTRHFALRFSVDFAHDQMLNDILKAGNTIRFSVGPAIQWGRNIVE